ncbi:MAG: hypothetical protein J6T10_24345 [Methanobrevibacter sp.]|nr:hypothetical protein [Methanobrevibacter sp.]
MISKPAFGWAHWELDNFKYNISYVQDFAHDFLNAAKNFFLDKDCQELQIDAEEDYYTIFLGYPVYARVNEEEDLILLDEDAEHFISEAIKDIEENMEAWANFDPMDQTKEEVEEEKKRLLKDIEEIKLLIFGTNF